MRPSYINSTIGSGQVAERKVSGVRWDLALDQIIMYIRDVAAAMIDLEPSNRAIVFGKIYDPFGLLSPIVVQLKIFIQGLV